MFNLALIAHAGRKAAMVALLNRHKECLKAVSLVATLHTGAENPESLVKVENPPQSKEIRHSTNIWPSVELLQSFNKSLNGP